MKAPTFQRLVLFLQVSILIGIVPTKIWVYRMMLLLLKEPIDLL